MSPRIGDRLRLHGAELVLRRATADDRAYILATWVNSALQGAPARRRRSAAVALRLVAEDRLRAACVVVACSADHTSTLHGWACGSFDAVHFAYVPHTLRGQGLGRVLIEACQHARFLTDERNAA